MNHLSRALAAKQRTLQQCQAALANKQSRLLALSRGPHHVEQGRRTDLLRANEQLEAFRSWVYAAIRPIGQTIAGQRIRVGIRSNSPSRMKPGTFSIADEVERTLPDSHRIIRLLSNPSNNGLVRWSLMFQTVVSLQCTGRALWYLPNNSQLQPIPTPWIETFELDRTTGSINSFVVRPPNHAGDPFVLPANRCCYFLLPHPADPMAAYSPLMAAAHAVNADHFIMQSQRSTFERGVHPSLALVVGKNPHPSVAAGVRPRLTDLQFRQLARSIQERYAGTHNHGQPLVLDGLIEKVERLSMSPSEMDWATSSKLVKEKILQIFGVNPIIMGEVEGANRASAVVADRHFVQHTVNPLIELMSQSLTEWLAPIFAEPGQNLIVWIEPAVADDAETKFKWAQMLGNFQVITGGELRGASPLALDASQFDEPASPHPANATTERQVVVTRDFGDDDGHLTEIIAALQAATDEVSKPIVIHTSDDYAGDCTATEEELAEYQETYGD